MKAAFVLISLLCLTTLTSAQSIPWQNYPIYNGTDLGLTYAASASSFRIWSPTAVQARVLLYQDGTGGTPLQSIELEKGDNGTWVATVPGEWKGKYYAFQVRHGERWSAEVPDPYVRAVGVNGRRGMVVDLAETNPDGWQHDQSPAFQNPVDAIVYELHVRDASIHQASGIHAKGKFMGLTERNTRNNHGQATGLDHLRALGVTHVHLLPSYDYNSVDESIPNNSKYNWGYDPLNYNVPEGSYATDASDGTTRIREFKKLIQTFHQNGLRVVLDVVYNHTALTGNSNFNELVPGYYYRQNPDGSFSNGTACGNETASERPMMRKFILESVLYWVREYHLDGFRFDLMGVHDIETMNLISDTLRKIRPDILLYGEGWTAGQVQIPEADQALKKNASRLNHIAVFSDDIRDGIKGSVFNHEERGFASGLAEQSESIRFGVVAACQHPQVNYAKVKYAKSAYASHPGNTVTYCECHDNHTLWDKLTLSATNASAAERKNMHKLALSIVLTSQGVCFLHAGTEFLRSKQGVENSFESPDAINAIDWNLKKTHEDVFSYVQHLIDVRKKHPSFRMTSTEQLGQHLRFLETPEPVVGYTINGSALNDSWKQTLVYYNSSAKPVQVTLPNGTWQYDVNSNRAVKPTRAKGVVTLLPYSCSILFR